jgi:hypothetical protein
MGDSSGKSQKSNYKAITPPSLGKLPLVPIIEIHDCASSLNNKIFRGDPGSVWVVSCPKGCVSSVGTVFGTSIYNTESSICKAAIHSGVIQDLGGLIEVVKTLPL